MMPTPGLCDTKPFISVHGVSLRHFDGRWFKPVHWQILCDQHWAVVGPNGSGKSTLMKAISCRVPVAGGRIVYHFVNNGASPSRQGRAALPQDHIAYVDFDSQKLLLKQENPFYQARWSSFSRGDGLSVSEYLSEGQVRKLNPYRVVETPSDPAAFAAQRAQVAGLLGIEPLLGRSIVQISSGERRKVLLAQALLRNPQLLILDNPFSGLDRGFRAKLREIISGLMQAEMRVMVVTASWDHIPPGITHVLLVRNNEVVDQGPKETILRSYSSSSTEGEIQLSAQLELSSAEDQRPQNAAAAAQVLVHMDSVSVSYNNVEILRHIDWTVRRREHWALLGPNGAGKTTLLSLIHGDNPQAYSNKITLFGKRRGSGESIWEIKQQIGWVAPELQLYYPRGVSCLDVVCSGFFDSLGLYHRCSSQQTETAMLWMQHLGMAQFADVAFDAISEGEQRVVLMARAVVKHPALLILDEPCQGLDALYRGRVLQTVDAIGKRLDGSVICVTQNPQTLPQIITHVLKLNQGRIVAKGRVRRRVSH